MYGEDCSSNSASEKDEIWQHSPDSNRQLFRNQGKNNSNSYVAEASNNWTALNNLPNIFNYGVNVNNNNQNICESDTVQKSRGRSPSQQHPNVADDTQLQSSDYSVSSDVNSGYLKYCEEYTGVIRPNYVSVNYLIETSDTFLSASTTVRSNSSDMGSREDSAGEGPSEVLGGGKATDTAGGGQIADVLQAIAQLATQVTALQHNVMVQNDRIRKLEGGHSSEDPGSEREPKSRGDKGKKDKNKEDEQNKKGDRVKEEKKRQLKVMKEKLRSRRQGKECTDSEEESTEDEVSSKELKKRMSSKEKRNVEKKLSSRLKQAGSVFPEEEYEDSTSSGRESSDSGQSRRRKVKSGAKVKKRPVVRQELWPHTIANEEDVDEVSSETIGLAKFLSCFTTIMMSAGKREAAGRSVLLNAVSKVLEFLPWMDARAFHNLVMVKIEQDRYYWGTDFAMLAQEFIDKRVRSNLRSGTGRGYSYGGSSKSSGYSGSNKYYSRNVGSFGNRSGYGGREKSLFALVCKQWNNGACTFGDRCKKWHVCWTCAEAGKPGELHKASSHGSSGSAGRQVLNQGR